MTETLGRLLTEFERLWPSSGAESWDANGLVIGNPEQSVSRVLLTVDVTAEVLDEAQEFDLILSHHPLLFRAVQTLSQSTAKGSIITQAIRENISIFAAHTNADVVVDGVSHTLAKVLGLHDVSPLVAAGSEGVGHGRIGKLGSPQKLGDFARSIARVLPATAGGVRVSGDYNQLVSRIAVCGGAGDSFIESAFSLGADVYVTSDLRHHITQEARENSLAAGSPKALIDISHWASEWLWLEVAAAQLGELLASVEFVVSQIRSDPWDFVVTQ